MKTLYLFLLLFLTQHLSAQYVDLSHLGLKGNVNTIYERLRGETNYDVFRAFSENGTIEALRKNIKKGDQYEIVITLYLYDEENKLIYTKTTNNDKITRESEYTQQGDTLIENRWTGDKHELVKQYFDKAKRQQVTIRKHTTTTVTFDKDYLPVEYRLSTEYGDVVTTYKTQVEKRDSQGNWLEAIIFNKHIATKEDMKTVWTRDIRYQE